MRQESSEPELGVKLTLPALALALGGPIPGLAQEFTIVSPCIPTNDGIPSSFEHDGFGCNGAIC